MTTTPQPARTGVTYEEWLRMPRTNQPHEILDGELLMSPAPTSAHQWRLFRIAKLLSDYVESQSHGVVLVAPVDVIIERQPRLRVRQPDILFFSSARTGIRGADELEQMPAIEVAPDLVVEILSPEERRRELDGKLADYAVLGALEAWLVSREGETVEVLSLHEGAYRRAGLFGRGDTVQSPVLPGIALTVDSLFA